MGENASSSWDDGKQAGNLAKHGYDFADLEEIFDGRVKIVRMDDRLDYGEERFNMLVAYADRVINVTFSPRAGKAHLISARAANRRERAVYHARQAAP